MAIRSLKTSSIATGTKRSKFWDQSALIITTAFRTLSSFTTGSNYPTPYGSQGQYNQSQMSAFPDAGVFVSVGGYTPGTTYSSVYTCTSPSSGWTNRTGYPTTVFQSNILALGDKFFQFGGNGLNGTAGGGQTNAIRYMTTSLSGWTTSSVTLPSAGGVGVFRTKNYFAFTQDGTNYYRGDGINAWTATTAFPTNTASLGYIKDGQTWALTYGTSELKLSNDDGTTWKSTGIVPPINSNSYAYISDLKSTGTASQIMVGVNIYNDGSNPTQYWYSFTGTAFTATSNMPAQGSSTSSMQGFGFFNNYFYINYNNSSPYYATLT